MAIGKCQAIALPAGVNGLQGVLQMPGHSQFTQRMLQHLPGVDGQQALHRPAAQTDDIDAEAIVGQVVGKLAANQTVPEDGDTSHATQAFTEAVIVLQIIDADQR
ncbi:hypothetical protein D3C80_1740770 [compost metagenome]